MFTMTDIPAAPRPRWRLAAYLSASVVLVALLVGAAGWYAYHSDRFNPQRGARLACQEAVTERLKSPGTAKHLAVKVGRNNSNGQTGKDRPYLVEGTMDAENGFGATVRVEYLCEIQLDGGEWRLVVQPNMQQR